MGPIINPDVKIFVPTWLLGAAVTATTMYSMTATQEPGKRKALQMKQRGREGPVTTVDNRYWHTRQPPVQV